MLSRSFTGPSIDASGSAFMNLIPPPPPSHSLPPRSHRSLSRCTCAPRAASRTLRFRCRHCTGIGCTASCRAECSYSRLRLDSFTYSERFSFFLFLSFSFSLFIGELLRTHALCETFRKFTSTVVTHDCHTWVVLIKFEINLMDT